MIARGRAISRQKGESLNAHALLKKMEISDQAIEGFFQPLILATLNAELHRVSGKLFSEMLSTILSSPARDGVLAYSTVGLSDIFARPAKKYIEEAGGIIHLSTRICKMNLQGTKIESIIDDKGKEYKADKYIFALPSDALKEIVPEGSIEYLNDWEFSPIVSVNIWYDRPIIDRIMIGLLGSHFHWVFDKASIIKKREGHPYVTLLISAANAEASLSKDALISHAVEEMKLYFKEAVDAKVIHAQVIKEKKATVRMSPSRYIRRPKMKTRFDNLLLAGDWIDTGLPATIESAVKSGFDAANIV